MSTFLIFGAGAVTQIKVANTLNRNRIILRLSFIWYKINYITIIYKQVIKYISEKEGFTLAGQNQNQNKKAPTSMSLQDRMFNQLKENRIKAKIYLINGFQLDGMIKEVDNFTVLIVDNGKEKLLYKHAISTIEPAKSVFY